MVFFLKHRNKPCKHSECGGHTVLGGDIADNVNVIHGKLPVGFLLAKTQSPALLPAAGMSLHTQKHRPLETHNTSFQYTIKPKTTIQEISRKRNDTKLMAVHFILLHFKIRISQEEDCCKFKKMTL